MGSNPIGVASASGCDTGLKVDSEEGVGLGSWRFGHDLVTCHPHGFHHCLEQLVALRLRRILMGVSVVRGSLGPLLPAAATTASELV